MPTIIIIVVLLLGGSWTTYRYLQTTTLALGTQLESVEQSISAQKWKTAQKDLNTAQQRWNQNKTWWTVLLDHQEIDNIDISMTRLEKYLKTQDISLSLGEVSTLKLQIDHISDTEKLNLQNIL
ncbi:MAG: DUF4363 family protein [Desulfosporosinus sp.]|nr:DUF4363 family protein [Desulfosporosinus sp.]